MSLECFYIQLFTKGKKWTFVQHYFRRSTLAGSTSSSELAPSLPQLLELQMAVPSIEHLPSSQFLMHSHKITTSELNKKICVCIPGTECSPLDQKLLCHSKCISFLKMRKVCWNLTSQALSWFTNLEFTIIRDFNRTYKTFQCKGLLLET